MAEDKGSGLTHSQRAAPSFQKVAFLEVGAGAQARRLAIRRREGAGPGVVWLGGFRSDMGATKATALDTWAAGCGRACLRFDYSGHGESGGRFTEGTITRWLADSLAVLATTSGPQVLVGSSMGGWLALLAARALAAAGTPPAGLVLLAPAVDFTRRLIWSSLDADARRAIETEGVHHRPSAYSPEPVPITRALLDDGRAHLLLEGAAGTPLRAHAPVHILQGMADPDVPWREATLLMEHLTDDPATLTLIRDGDHRLSRPVDIERLIAAVEGIA